MDRILQFFLLASCGFLLLSSPLFANEGLKQTPKTPAETREQAAAPKSQTQIKKNPEDIRHFVPKAQQGLTPQQATFKVEVGSDPSIPHFEKEEIKVKPGAIVSLTFRNQSDKNSDNWLLTQPGKDEEVGMAGMKAGPQAGYIPVLPDQIIATTRMLKPGESETILFRAPQKPGHYPYISTFPGHWEAMKGELIVEGS